MIMTHFLITTCCKEKDPAPEPLPAIRRYLSRRIAWVHAESQRQGIPLLILSGEYGLLRPEDKIHWYDHALQMEEVLTLVPRLVSQLKALGIREVTFYARPKNEPGWAPYHAALEGACQAAGVELHCAPWEDSPPGRTRPH